MWEDLWSRYLAGVLHRVSGGWTLGGAVWEGLDLYSWRYAHQCGGAWEGGVRLQFKRLR